MEDLIEKNYILAELYIGDEDINKNIRIINSYEEFIRTNYPSFFEEMIKTHEHINNEEEIKQTQIRINGELIPFSYFHQFKRKGNYTIKYSFKHYLTKTNSMFNDCDCFTKIDLSNFNAEKVNVAHCMFSCESLKYLDLSCFNNKNIDFRGIVGGCISLKYENVITNNNFLLKYVKSSLNPF
jgi:surface protein